MNLYTLIIIYFTLFFGPMITMTSSNLMLMWIGLEMSLLSIIPLLVNKNNPRSIEAATKYFITQATASMIFLLAISSNFYQLGIWSFQEQTNNFIIMLTTISMTMKLGLAPFHSWLPEVTQGIPLHTGLLILTWQKIAPLSILFQIHELLNIKLTTTMAIISIIAGAWGGLNQTQTRKILAYSSIAHMGWMIAILPYNPYMTIFNFSIYVLLTFSLFIMFMSYSLTSINLASLTWNKIPTMLFIFPTTLLSLGGLPPLTGFLPKWLIMTELLKNNSIILTTLLAMTALLNLFFYTRLIYSTTLTIFPTNNNSKMIYHQTNPKTNIMLPITTTMSTLLLPLTPLLMV
ncbi:NADH dehydrogenase subunit 2 (mitochondrion) [Psammomys obesus]|uniref:NADH-ubiquinone oxidoreductase chain 2 n=1 Tax=Psammomys obesus TaxID=48139 RepID=A0A343W5Q1_PSAOB|nr:NADH dehydrogenase subunit 2 [Psammomys obesus]AVW85923.1 NADH dehydrogenase subunit 2 [Psammomys obesus]